MGEIETEVREWLRGQQDWLQEAARRLLENGKLTDGEIEELTVLLKSPEGRATTNVRTFGGLSGHATVNDGLRLVRICNIVGIEDLAPRRPLEFSGSNLVVVYGHNGAGKSGYTRILKKAAGKPRAASLRSNVFQLSGGKRCCEIAFSQAGKDESVEWHPDGDPINALRALDIFDAEEATHYLSKEGPASYSHPILTLFEALAKTCDRIRSVLQREQDSLVSALPVLPTAYAESPAGLSYLAIGVATTKTKAEALVAWTEEDAERLKALEMRLKEHDPAALAKRKRSAKRQVEKIISALHRDIAAYSAEGIAAIRSLRNDATRARKVAQDAGLLATARLEGIGSESWIALWGAAKAYSATAYPGKEFPVTEGDARCVLCHQTFSPDAIARMRDFESFVAGTLSATADRLEREYQAAIEALPPEQEADTVRTQCEAAALTDVDCVASLVKFWNDAADVRKCLVNGETEATASQPEEMVTIAGELQKYADRLEEHAAQCDRDAAGLNRDHVEKEKLELEARLWISQQALAIEAEIARLKQWKDFDSWKSVTNSGPVSIKAGKLAEKLITKAYVSRFNRELQALGAKRLKVELVKTRTDHGTALHRLQLVGAKQPVGAELVLSEGERRVASLAAFLADVADKPIAAPFLFDDPISSLDQVWEERAAARLRQLSESRQVVVFTHRLSMVGLLGDEASVINLRREPWGAGETGETPIFAKRPERALNDLRTRRLAQAKKVQQEDGSEVYYPLVKSICSDFRILIERFVETYVLAEIVQRHRREVNTKGRIHNLLKLQASDCDLIDEMMSKYSRYEHSQSSEAPVEPPPADELAEDMERLSEWHREFQSRVVPACATS